MSDRGGAAEGSNESLTMATTESAFFIEPPDDPALAPCISFVLKSDIEVRELPNMSSTKRFGALCPYSLILLRPTSIVNIQYYVCVHPKRSSMVISSPMGISQMREGRRLEEGQIN